MYLSDASIYSRSKIDWRYIAWTVPPREFGCSIREPDFSVRVDRGGRANPVQPGVIWTHPFGLGQTNESARWVTQTVTRLTNFVTPPTGRAAH